MQPFDLLVIGSGPSGQRAAVQAAKLGKKVAVIENRLEIGGVSVHTGTIPSKTVREAVLYLTGWRQRGFYGRNHREKQIITIDDVMHRVDMTLSHQVEVMQHQLQRNGVTVISGTATFLNDKQISVASADGSKQTFSAHHFLIAVGTKPHRPAHIPFDGKTILDSDDILKITSLPRSMMVIGAGVIGLEYATIFNALDVEVTIVESRDSVLNFVDNEITDELIHQMRDRGMSLRLQEQVDSIQHNAQKKVITTLKSGKKICTDIVLFAAGRSGATDTLGLNNIKIKPDKRGQLSVNENYQTNIPHIYAAGDVIGFPSLAATSMEQGRLAACHAFNHTSQSHTEYFPYGIYSVPEISMVGMTENTLREKNIPYESGIARFRETARGQILGLREGMLKILFSIENQKLLGVHIIGEGATELIHIGQAVITLGGSIDYFVDSAFNYPTLAEAYKVAALNAWNRMSAYKATALPSNKKITKLRAAK